jgi:hypothetical protein
MNEIAEVVLLVKRDRQRALFMLKALTNRSASNLRAKNLGAMSESGVQLGFPHRFSECAMPPCFSAMSGSNPVTRLDWQPRSSLGYISSQTTLANYAT